MSDATLAKLLAENPKPKIVMIEKNVPRQPFSGFQFSPSAVDTFDDCERKWAFSKIDRVPRVQHESAAFGTRVHALREKWLTEGIMPDDDTFEGKVALAGLEHLPMPKLGHVELPIKRDVGFGFYLGYIDYFLEDQGAVGYRPTEVEWLFDQDGVPLVLDHKTTADKQYVKDPDTLIHKDPQGALYGMDAFLRVDSSVDEVDLFWHYLVKKKRPVAIPVRARAKKSDIEANFEKQMETAKRMLSIFDTPGIVANDVEPTGYAKGTCDKYGGCPHRERCVISNQYKLGALTMSTSGSDKLMEKLLAEAAAKGVDVGNLTTPLSGQAKPAPKPAPNGNGSNGKSLAALGAALKDEDEDEVSSEVKVPTTTPPPPSPKKKGSMAALLASAGTPPPPVKEKPTPAPAPPVEKQEAKPTLADVAQQAVVPPDAQEPDLDATPESANPPKKKATRKKKAATGEALSRHDQFVLAVFSALMQRPQNNAESAAVSALLTAKVLMNAIDEDEKAQK
jgi:hypothetical protein